MAAAIEAEVVGELPDVLVEDVVDRERFVASRRIGDAALADVDCRKRFAERIAVIAKAIIAHEGSVRGAGRATVQLECVRVEPVDDGVACVSEWQARGVRSAAGVVVAEHERVGRQVAFRVEIVVTEREVVGLVHVPIQLRDQLPVPRLVDVALIRSGVIVVDLDQPIADRVHSGWRRSSCPDRRFAPPPR